MYKERIKQDEWFGLECQYAIKKREELRKSMFLHCNEDGKKDYEKLRKNCETLCKEKKRKQKIQVYEKKLKKNITI